MVIAGRDLMIDWEKLIGLCKQSADALKELIAPIGRSTLRATQPTSTAWAAR